MKKYLIALTVLVLGSLVLIACTGGAAPTATEAPTTAPTEAPIVVPTEAPTEAPAAGETPAATEAATAAAPAAPAAMEVEPGASIIFSGWGDDSEQKVYRDSIARFNEIYPDVKVDYQPIPTDFQTKLKAAMAGGTAADVFYVDDQLMTAFAPTNQLLPLDDYMQTAGVSTSDFIPQLMSEFELNGKTYALPKDWGTLGLVYLPEAFKEAGIPEPTASWTWDDVKTAAQTIKDKTKYAAFCQNADWARFAAWALQNGVNYTSDDYKTATANSQAMLDAATFVTDMYKAELIRTATDVGASWCGEAIGKQLVAMTYEGGWMVNFMRTTYPDVDYNAVPLPAGPKGQADIIFTNGIGVNAHTKYPKASAALAIFLTSRYNQFFIQDTGFAYSTHPDQLSLITNPIDQAISTGGTWAGTRIAYYGPNTGKIEDAITKALERVYLGSQTVQDSFDQANATIESLLAGQ